MFLYKEINFLYMAIYFASFRQYRVVVRPVRISALYLTP